MRQRHLLLSLVGLLLLSAGTFWYMTRRPEPVGPHGITKQGFGLIEIGSKVEDVQALLGLPPGDHTTKSYYVIELIGGWPDVGRPLRELVADLNERDWCRVWAGDDGVIEVRLNEDGNVVSKHFYEVRPHRDWAAAK